MTDCTSYSLEQLGHVDRRRRLAHPGALHRDRVALPGAGEAEHPAHLAVAAGVLEERLGDPLGAQRVAGHQDEGRDLAGLRRRCGCSSAATLGLRLASDVDYPHERLAAGRARPGGAYAAADEAWLEERWADPETRVLVVAGTRVRPVDGAVAVGVAGRRPRGPAGAAGGAGRPGLVRGDPPAGGGRVDRRRVVPAARPAAAPRRPEPVRRAAGLPRAGLAEWLFVTRYCPRCGGALEAARGRPRAGVHRLRARRSSRAPTRR